MKRTKIIANLLVVAVLVSPVLAFSLASIIGETNIFGVAGIIRYIWVMWLFIPLGILSILISAKLKKHNCEHKMNFVVAIICIPVLIVFGSFRFVYNEITYDADKATTIESMTGLDLPNQVKLAAEKFDEEEIIRLKITDEKEKSDFERDLSKNTRWKTQLSLQAKGVLSPMQQYKVEMFDRFVFYNVTKGGDNIFPTGEEFEYIFVAYDYEFQSLIIIRGIVD